MSVRVYTLLTPGQKAELEELAVKQDRSVSYLIARAIDQFIGHVSGAIHTSAEATEKVFTRTTEHASADVKAKALRLNCHDWQAVNAAVQHYLKEYKCAS